MNKIGLVFICLCCGISSVGQSLVTGQIVNIKNRQPIEAATVYIDGTSNGTQTDINGRFKLETRFPASMVVSHVAFDPQILSLTDSATNVVIQMSERIVVLDEITVNSKNTWEYDFAKFKRWFLGTDYWAENALIKNDDVLNFDTDPYGRFTAQTSGPIVIELPKLGYRITAEIEGFTVGWNSAANGQVGGYVGHYYFSAYKDTANQEVYRINRTAAYFNSAVHFLRALYENRLEENGFAVSENVPRSVTNQKGLSPVCLQEFVQFVGNELKIIGLQKKTFVIQYFHNDDGRPTNLNFGRKELSVQSTVRFFSDTCTVRSDGTIPDKAILFSGAIQKKQVGAMLPQNFQPDH